ncbi:MAG: TonB-dependent receptor [Bacteroidia bacterium]|nr:TonB-dependent receptor [Bacteroidia bacterium]
MGGKRLILLVGFLWSQEDSVRSYQVDTVRIEALRSLSASVSEGNAEKVFRLAPGTQGVYRSVPFAQEVVYQGLMPQQTQITIDGMRLLPACVDRMDPVLTFVETAVIDYATWRTMSNWGATPTLNIELFSPEGPAGGQAVLLLGDNYHRLLFSAHHRQKIGPLALASALTFRLGTDYRIGKNLLTPFAREDSAWERDTVLHLPSLRKLNAYTALRYNLSEAHAVEVSYLGDYFYDVAYPALIMDARHSAMHMASLRHLWKEVSVLRLYANTVYHDMTDEGRSETEIRGRLVMPNMYMPMKGLTYTIGGVWELRWLKSESFEIHQRSEYTFSAIRAQMDMLPIDGGTPMRLANLPDIRFRQGGSALSVVYQKGAWRTQVEGRLNAFSYAVGDTVGFIPLRLYQEAYAGGSVAQRQFLTYEAILRSSYTFGGHSVRGLVSIGTRAPTHTELYAYYLYVPMDNSIQMGNSTLKPERLLRTELSYEYRRGLWMGQLSAFFNQIHEYISPITFLPIGASGNSTRQQWRILKNTGSAYTVGFTAHGSVHLSSLDLLEGWMGYTKGWHQTLREPLPWIYPFFGRLRYTRQYRRHQFSLEVYGAAAQSHLSRTIYIEDYSPAYWLAHVRYAYRVWERAAQIFYFTASVENLFNAYGWDHLSVGNMPFLGRLVRIGVSASW